MVGIKGKPSSEGKVCNVMNVITKNQIRFTSNYKKTIFVFDLKSHFRYKRGLSRLKLHYREYYQRFIFLYMAKNQRDCWFFAHGINEGLLKTHR